MAVNTMQFYSDVLGRYVRANVILPLPRRGGPAKPLPVLTLLHGMGDDYSAWLARSGVERYALQAGLAVIMPDGALSCYENMAHGGRYRDFILEELPEIMHACFPLSRERSKNFIAGCSMGGFGALKLGLAAAEKWSVIGCFSAGHREYRPDSPRNLNMLENAYGDFLPEIEAQMERDAMNPAAPRIWHCCGDRDVLRENAEQTRAFLSSIPGLDYHFEMLPGSHDWNLWDEALRRFISTLPISKPEVRLL